MTPARALVCLAWLLASTAYGAGAHAADPAVDLGGHALPGGTPSTDRAAPVVLPPGLWGDTLGAPDSPTSTHYFRYERTIADSTVHVGVVGASLETETPDGLAVTVTVEGEDCGEDDAGPGYPILHGTFGAGVAVGPEEVGDRDSVCLTSPTLEIAVSRGQFTSSTEELPIAIKIVEEAPPADAADLPAPETVTARPVTSSAAARDLDGARGFDDAPLIEATGDGAVVGTAVTEGQERLWRVPLTWGQRVGVAARVPVQPEEMADDFIRPTVELHFVAPDRNAFAGAAEDAESSGAYGDEAVEIYDATPPVAFLNRYDENIAALPGDYWVAVAVSAPTEDRDPVDVPVELTLTVAGERDGVPSYPQTVTAPGGDAGPDGYSPDTPFLVGEGEFAAMASGSPAPLGEDGDGSSWGARRWAGLGLGLASVGCLAAGAVWLRRTA